MSKNPKRPKDPNQLARLIVGIATGEILDESTIQDETKNSQKVESGRKGGLKGGNARAEKLTKEQRSNIAKAAAEARWRDKN